MVVSYDELLSHLLNAHGKLASGWDGEPYAELAAEHERIHAAGLDLEIGPIHEHA